MKTLIFLLFFSPLLLSSQVQKIIFNCKGFSTGISKDNISSSLDTFLRISSNFSFKVVFNQSFSDANGFQHITLQQYYKDYPIEGCIVKLHYRYDVLYYINGSYLNNNNLNINNIYINEAQALNIALTYTAAKKYIWDKNDNDFKGTQTKDLKAIPKGQLVIYCKNDGSNDSMHLSYKFDIFSIEPISHNYVFIDGKNGQILARHNRLCASTGTADTRYSGARTIITSPSGTEFELNDLSRGSGIQTLNDIDFPGTAATEFLDNDDDWTSAEYHNSAKDDAALDAHWGAEMTYDYFLNVHGRNSFDNSGGAVTALAHFNAFGSANSIFLDGGTVGFGDGGDGFDAFTSLDIVAHELGHAMNAQTANLGDENEPGALNEGFSDMWGSCVEEYSTSGKQTWQFGEDIDDRGSGFDGLRSLSDPKSCGLPDTYEGTNWVTVSGCTPTDRNDQCGVHINCGVADHWFFLLCEGGPGTNDIGNSFSVTGITIDEGRQIIYRAESVYMTSTTTYSDVRKFTIQAAQDIFGDCSPEVISTMDAWFAVGVGVSFESLSDLVITTTLTSGTSEDFYSPDLIEANNIISSGANIKYQAASQINLESDFVASNGSSFVAEIVPCRDLSSSVTGPIHSAEDKKLDRSILASPSKSVLTIFPNPTENSFSIIFDEEFSQSLNINIVDLNGKIIKSAIVNQRNNKIDTSNLASGCYLIQFINANKEYRYKLIKI